MKITATAGELATTMSAVELALDTKIRIQILGAVHITAAADGAVKLIGNAMDRAITITNQVRVMDPGETAIRASALAGLVRGFAKNDIVTINTDAQGAEVRCQRSTYRLPVMPVEDLPAVPTIDAAVGEIEVDRQEVIETIKQILFAVSREQTRYYLNGILLHDAGDHLVLVATDGHRLARRQIVSEPFSPDHKCIVPVDSIPAITKILTRATIEKVKLRRSSTLFEVITPGFVFVSKLIDGTFPDYSRVVPVAPKNNVVVDRAELGAALARLGAVAEDSKRVPALVGLGWDPADPVLHLSLPNQPGMADDIIIAATSGNAPVQTAAKITHITELVGQMQRESVCIASTDGNSPILITDPEDDALLVIQMPCRFSQAA
jgi:DNA polymerase-3 subunit beta